VSLEKGNYSLFEGIISTLACRDWQKPQEASVRVIGKQAEIRNGNLQNKTFMRY
jgi:hypothetical protein